MIYNSPKLPILRNGAGPRRALEPSALQKHSACQWFRPRARSASLGRLNRPLKPARPRCSARIHRSTPIGLARTLESGTSSEHCSALEMAAPRLPPFGRGARNICQSIRQDRSDLPRCCQSGNVSSDAVFCDTDSKIVLEVVKIAVRIIGLEAGHSVRPYFVLHYSCMDAWEHTTGFISMFMSTDGF